MSAKAAPADVKRDEVPPIPKRPLTAYNLFSILERHYILQHTEYAAPKSPKSESAEGDEEMVDQTLDPHYARRPPRYKNVILPANWYVVRKNRKKRADHRCHGLISFSKLSTMISDAWAQADEYTKSFCKSIPQSELIGYRAEQKVFKEKYGKEAFDKQTRKRKNAETAARGENKKKKGLKKYEKASKVLEEKIEEEVEEKEDNGKVPAVKDKEASLAAAAAEVTAAPQAGRALAPFTPLVRLLQERQLIAQRLYMLTYGDITQGNDQLGQAIRSMNQERVIAQELAIQRALRNEVSHQPSHQGIFASIPHLDPRLAGMQMEQMKLRRGEDLTTASAPTGAVTADGSQKKSLTSTPEENRLEQLSLRLGGVAQRDRLAQLMKSEKAALQDRLAVSGNSITKEARTSHSSMPQQGSSLLCECGGIVSSEAKRNSPHQQHPQQDRISLIMSLEGLAGKAANERMAALAIPVVLDRIQNLQLLRQRRLQLQEVLQQRLAQAAFLPGRTNVLAGTVLNGQLTHEEMPRLEVEKIRAAVLEQLKK